MSFCNPQPSSQCLVPYTPTCPPPPPCIPMCPPPPPCIPTCPPPPWGGSGTGVYPVPVVNPYPQQGMGGCTVPPGPGCPPPPGNHCVTICWPR